MRSDAPAVDDARVESDARAVDDARVESDAPAAYEPPVWNLDATGGSDYAPPLWDLAEDAPVSRPLTRRELRERRAAEEPVTGQSVGFPGPAAAPVVESAMVEPESWAGVSQVPPPPSESFTVPRLAAGFRTSRVSEIPVSAVRAAEMVAPGAGGSGFSNLVPDWSGALDVPAADFPDPAQPLEVEAPTTTDGFGMPAVLMDAPVLPALRPIEEIEAELIEPPASPDPHDVVPTPHVARPLPRLATDLPPAPYSLSVRSVAPVGVPSAAEPRTPSALAAAAAAREAVAATPVLTPPSGSRVVPAVDRSHAPAPIKRRPPNPIVPESLLRPPSPWQAVYGAWIGVVSIVVWPLGVVAVGLGAWSMVLAAREGYGRIRPVTALVGGAIGVALGIGFVLFGPS
jgi:hypothetical protein